MKSRLVLLGIVVLALSAGPALTVAKSPAGPAPTAGPPASTKRTNGDVVIAKGETVKNATAVNGSLTVYGHVTGDAKAVNGDVRVRFGGIIDGDATAVNGSVNIDLGGKVRGGMLSTNGGGAHSRTLTQKTSVHGDVVVEKGQTVKEATTVRGDVIVYGHVTGDATVVMGDIDVRHGGKVDGRATAVMGNVRVRNGGKVGGDATCVMGSVIHEVGGTIGGSTTSVGFPLPWWMVGGFGNMRGLLFFAIVWTVILVAQVLVAAIVVAIWPGRMQAIAECSFGRPGWSLIYGLIGLVAALPLALLLLITCVGIPFIGVEIVLLFIMWIAGGVGVKLALGQKVRHFGSPVWAAAVGAVLLGLVGLIPLAGGLIVNVLFLMGVGAVIMTGFGTAPDWFVRRFPPTAPPLPAPGAAQGTGDSGGDSAPPAATTP